jgi:hypothetical protein
MINKLRMLLAVSAIAVTGAAVSAFAADTDPMHITVPFAFKAGKTTLPAGDYVVVEENSGIVMIKGTGGNAILLSSAGSDNTSDKAGVSFARGEQGYVLTSVHSWGRITSSILPIVAGQEK